MAITVNFFQKLLTKPVRCIKRCIIHLFGEDGTSDNLRNCHYRVPAPKSLICLKNVNLLQHVKTIAQCLASNSVKLVLTKYS